MHHRAGQSHVQGLEDCRATAVCLATPLQDGAVTRTDRQGSDLYYRIRSGFKDHPQHPQGHGDPLQHKAIVEGAVELPQAQGIGQGRHLAHPFNGAAQLVVIELEPGHQGGGQLLCRRCLHICLVCREDFAALFLQGIGHGQQGLAALFITALSQLQSLAAQAYGHGQQGGGGVRNGNEHCR